MPELYLATGHSAGDECSSTYEGRHLTLEESYLTHPSHADGLVDKGDPVLCGANIVGVALKSAAAATDLIAIDTEGIWFLDAYGLDDDGNSDIVPGDEIYINKTTCVLSKIADKNSHQRFGYALGNVSGGSHDVVAIKVHWNPDDAEELVGTSAVNYSSAKAGHKFREYRYTASNVAGDHRGEYIALTMTGAGASGEAIRGRTIVGAALAGGVHGGHFGVEHTAAGSITGLAAGVRGTFLAKNASATGTICGGMSELWAAGAATDYTTASHSIHRFVNDGNPTGKATAQNVWSFDGLSTTQLQNYAAWDTGLAKVLRVTVDGDVYYVGLSTVP